MLKFRSPQSKKEKVMEELSLDQSTLTSETSFSLTNFEESDNRLMCGVCSQIF